MTNDFDNR